MQALTGLDSLAVERLRADLTALVGPLADRRLGVAVSGGPDSMALLALAAAAFPGQVIAATVDHGLRAESANEAAMVTRWCEDAGVPHATLAIADRPGARDNLHDWARRQRYRLLGDWAVAGGASLLATAHHADDQAETFLMRAARGSGVAGLAGIRAVQPLADLIARAGQVPPPPGDELGGITLLRPLLTWRRAELRALAEAARFPFIDDPSNADPRFDRAQYRALLARTPLLDAAQVARSAAHVAEAEATLAAIEAWLWRERVRREEDSLALDIAELPRELRRRLARGAIEQVRLIRGITRPTFSAATNIESLLDALEAGKAATQAGVIARPVGTLWRFAEAPPRRLSGSAQSG
ncbi:tRNA lysidine(34) synthetase TilS [Sphingomonas sp.]|uniref:tRNA lysidine(34) synthetase TilS n=1 Tax=Sphingomonas sp. TaxID=28214 RepID=UPI0025DC4361|nr:tRNA lysidine(34) synthetase TilS [Sphingomonas sp.]